MFDRDVGYILDLYIPQCDDIVSTLASLRNFTIHIVSLWLFDLASKVKSADHYVISSTDDVHLNEDARDALEPNFHCTITDWSNMFDICADMSSETGHVNATAVV